MSETSSLTVGGLRVSHVIGSGFSAALDLAPRAFDPAEALALAEWLKSRALDEIDHSRTARWREERRMKRDEKAAEAVGLAGVVRRWWYCFYTRSGQVAKAPTFLVWSDPAGLRDTFMALIDTEGSPAALVLESWPDARERWCFEKSSQWCPDEERFPRPKESPGGR